MSSGTVSLKKTKKKKNGLGWIEWMRGWFNVLQEILLQRLMSSHLHNPLPLPPLNHLTCIVTGSTSGIGSETARFQKFKTETFLLAFDVVFDF